VNGRSLSAPPSGLSSVGWRDTDSARAVLTAFATCREQHDRASALDRLGRCGYGSAVSRPAVVSLFGELWAFMRVRKKWWLGPIVVVLVLFGALIVLSQGSALAPFVYALF
jgi:Family of unknown function (DUF5989)